VKKYFALIILLCLITKHSVMIGQEYIYKQYTTADGLPSSEVYHVFQDSKGYIWFATDNGVSRYNGYEFENFDVNNGLATNSISEVYEDFNGKVWFIGMNRKLSYYENGKIVRFKYNQKFSSLFSRGQVPLKSSFYIDSLNNIIISITRDGIYSIDTTGNIKNIDDVKNGISLYNQFKEKIISSYQYLDTSNIEVKIFNNKESLITKLKISFLDRLGSHVFTVSKSNNEYIFTNADNVFRISGDKIDRLTKTGNHIQYLYKDAENNLWLCNRNGGAVCYQNMNINKIKRIHYLADKNVSSVLLDKNNGLWFSTLNTGIYYLPSKLIKRLDERSGLASKNIYSIALGENSILVAHNSPIISKLLFNNNSIEQLKIGNTNIITIQTDTLRKISYLGSFDWLYTLDNKKKIKLIKNIHSKNDSMNIGQTLFNVNSILLDKNSLWLAGGFGFFKLENDKVKFDSRFDKNFMMRVNAIAKVDSSILLGTEKGLWKYEKGKLKSYAKEDSLLGHRILDIKQKDNIIFLATKGSGIIIKNGSNLKQITRKEGLNSNTIKCLFIEDSVLWSGSENGLNKTQYIKKVNGIILGKTIEVPEMNQFEIRQIIGKNDKLYVATNNGLIEFEKKLLTSGEKSIPIYITSLKVNGFSRKPKKTYELNFDENNIQINYEALYYKRTNSIKYRYKLAGLDKDWIYTTTREARYYYLPAGEYQFVIEVQNENKIWSSINAKIDFKIIPAIWQTNPFKAGIVLFALNLLVMVFKVRQASNKHRTMLKTDVNTFMNQAITRQIHPHFLFNTLNSINNYILRNDKKSASSYLTKFSKLIRNVLEHS